MLVLVDEQRQKIYGPDANLIYWALLQFCAFFSSESIFSRIVISFAGCVHDRLALSSCFFLPLSQVDICAWNTLSISHSHHYLVFFSAVFSYALSSYHHHPPPLLHIIIIFLELQPRTMGKLNSGEKKGMEISMRWEDMLVGYARRRINGEFDFIIVFYSFFSLFHFIHVERLRIKLF